MSVEVGDYVRRIPGKDTNYWKETVKAFNLDPSRAYQVEWVSQSGEAIMLIGAPIRLDTRRFERVHVEFKLEDYL
jgi:hypothetical protein